MLLRHRSSEALRSLRTVLQWPIRSISQSAAVAQEIVETHLDYLEGFPRPDLKHDETIVAIPRAKSGKIISAKERKEWRVPSIVFEQEDGQRGGNKRLISVHSKQIRKLVNHVGYHFFLSRLFNLEVRAEFDDSAEIIEKVRVLPRKLHLHAGTDAPLNVTFMRAPSNALLKIDVPLVYRGEDACPGLRKGGRLNTIKRMMKYLCPADIVPPYIDVDLSELEAGQKLLARDLKVHPALKLLRSPDEPICNIIGARVSEQRKSK
ncbi:ribosomal protein L25/Gln-tRNA synthetase, anti-codon-binding domain-containing protein [Wolffia australiana]